MLYLRLERLSIELVISDSFTMVFIFVAAEFFVRVIVTIRPAVIKTAGDVYAGHFQRAGKRVAAVAARVRRHFEGAAQQAAVGALAAKGLETHLGKQLLVQLQIFLNQIADVPGGHRAQRCAQHHADAVQEQTADACRSRNNRGVEDVAERVLHRDDRCVTNLICGGDVRIVPHIRCLSYIHHQLADGCCPLQYVGHGADRCSGLAQVFDLIQRLFRYNTGEVNMPVITGYVAKNIQPGFGEFHSTGFFHDTLSCPGCASEQGCIWLADIHSTLCCIDTRSDLIIVALHIGAVGHHFDPQCVSALKIVICESRFCGRRCIFRRDNLRFRRHIDAHFLLGTVLVRILQNGLNRKIVCTVFGDQFVQHFIEFIRCIDAARIVRIVIFLAEFNKIGSCFPNRAGQLRLFPCVFAVIVGVPLLIQRQIRSRDGFDLL